jgi:hypothetical protein
MPTFAIRVLLGVIVRYLFRKKPNDTSTISGRSRVARASGVGLVSLVVAGIPTAESTEFCVVNSNGNTGSCWSSLEMCQQEAPRWQGMCVVSGDSTSSGRSLRNRVQSREERIPEKPSPPSTIAEPEFVISDELAATIDRDAKEWVQKAIDLGCKHGADRAAEVATAWSRMRTDMDQRLRDEKTDADRRVLDQRLAEVRKRLLQQHYDKVYEFKKYNESWLADYSRRKELSDSEHSRLKTYNAIKEQVVKFSVFIGWDNPSASATRLERLMVEDCLKSNEQDP